MKLFNIYLDLIKENKEILSEVTDLFDLSSIEPEIRKMYDAIKFEFGSEDISVPALKVVYKKIKKIMPGILDKINEQINQRSNPQPNFFSRYKKDKDFRLEDLVTEVYAFDELSDPLVIEGSFKSKHKDERPWIGLSLSFHKGVPFTMTYENFKAEILDTLQHELIHLGQNISYKDQKHQTRKNYAPANDFKGKYFSHHLEINAFAAGIIQAFHSSGYSKDKVRTLIKSMRSLLNDPLSKEFMANLVNEIRNKTPENQKKVIGKFQKILTIYMDKIYEPK